VLTTAISPALSNTCWRPRRSFPERDLAAQVLPGEFAVRYKDFKSGLRLSHRPVDALRAALHWEWAQRTWKGDLQRPTPRGSWNSMKESLSRTAVLHVGNDHKFALVHCIMELRRFPKSMETPIPDYGRIARDTSTIPR
jgi:hypothetical protein